MGNKLASIPTSSAVLLIQDLLEFTTEEAKGTGRYLRTILCRHDEGRVAIKVFFRGTWNVSSTEHGTELDKILLNIQRLIQVRDAFSQVSFPHVWPYQSYLNTERALFVVRQWHSRTLSERIGTRPFLSGLEKLWIFYQLLEALRQSHQLNIYHGDIKSDNVVVSLCSWVYLTDFAFHKPTLIAENDPAGFSYFFDSNGLRTCYLAPERLVNPADFATPPNTPEGTPYSPPAPRSSRMVGTPLQTPTRPLRARSISDLLHEFDMVSVGGGGGPGAEGSHMLTPAMDIYSLGCVMVELFLNGENFMSFENALKYRHQRSLFETEVLARIDNVHVREILNQMTAVDPLKRPTATKLLDSPIFPRVFIDLRVYLGTLMTMSPDKAVSTISSDWPLLTGEYANWAHNSRTASRIPAERYQHCPLFSKHKHPHPKSSLHIEAPPFSNPDPSPAGSAQCLSFFDLQSVQNYASSLLSAASAAITARSLLRKFSPDDLLAETEALLSRLKAQDLAEPPGAFPTLQAKPGHAQLGEAQVAGISWDLEKTINSSSLSSQDLMMLLVNGRQPDLSKSFRDLLEAKKCPENFDFLLAIFRYHQAAPHQRLRIGRKMFYQFLDSSASSQVYFGSEHSSALRRIRTVLDDQRAPADLFDPLFYPVFNELIGTYPFLLWKTEQFPLSFPYATQSPVSLFNPLGGSSPQPSSSPLSSTPISSTPLSSTPISSTPTSTTPLQSPLGMGRLYLPPLPAIDLGCESPDTPRMSRSFDPVGSLPTHFAELLLPFVLSRIRTVEDPSLRCSGLTLLMNLSECLHDSIRLQRILPYVVTMVSPTEHRTVSSLAITILPQILGAVQEVDQAHSEIFADYILPVVSSILSLPDDLILRSYASHISTYASTAVAFLELSGSAHASPGVSFDQQLHRVRDIIFEQMCKVLGSPSASSVAKRMLLQDLFPLCKFFGVDISANQFLPAIIFEVLANKNTESWELRAEFFRRIVPIAQNFFDQVAFFSILYPILVGALTDLEGFVVEQVLKSISALLSHRLFSRSHVIELSTRVIPLCVHPNPWISNAALTCISALSAEIAIADRPLILSPLLSPYAIDGGAHHFEDVKQLSEDLQPPLSPETFDSLVKIAYICQHYNPEDPEVSSDENSSSFSESFISLILESGRFADRQVPLFQAMSRFFGSLAARSTFDEDEIEAYIDSFSLAPSPSLHQRGLASSGGGRSGTPSPSATRSHPDLTPPLRRQSSTVLDPLKDALAGSPANTRANSGTLDLSSLADPLQVVHDLQSSLPPNPSRRLRSQKWTRFFTSRSRRKIQQGLREGSLRQPLVPHQSIDGSRPVAYAILDPRKSKYVLAPPTASQRAKSPQVYPEESFFQQFDMSLSSPSIRESRPQTEETLFRTGLISSAPTVSVKIPRNRVQRRFAGTIDEELNDLYALLPTKPIGTGKVKQWRPQGKLLFDLPDAHSTSITSVRCSPDHNFVATCSVDGLVKLWDSQAFSPSNKTSVLRESGLYFHGDGAAALNCMAFVENSRSIITGSDTGTIQVTRVDSFAEPSYEGLKGSKRRPDPSQVASHNYRSTAVELIEPFKQSSLNRSPIVSIEHYNSADRLQSLVFYGSAAGRIAAFDLRSGKDAWALHNPPHLGPMLCFALPHWDRTLLTTGSSRGFYCVWDLRFNGLLKCWRHPDRSEFPVRTLAPIHEDGFFAAIGPNQVWKWDIPSNSCSRIYRMRPSPRYSSRTRINTTVFPLASTLPSPSLVDIFESGPELTSSAQIEAVHKSLTSIGEFSIPRVSSLYHPMNSDYLITGSSDGTVRYWNERDISLSTQIYQHTTRYPPPKYLRLLSDPVGSQNHEYFDEVELNEMDSFLYYHRDADSKKRTEYTSAHPDSITAIEVLQKPQPILITADRTGGIKVCV